MNHAIDNNMCCNYWPALSAFDHFVMLCVWIWTCLIVLNLKSYRCVYLWQTTGCIYVDKAVHYGMPSSTCNYVLCDSNICANIHIYVTNNRIASGGNWRCALVRWRNVGTKLMLCVGQWSIIITGHVGLAVLSCFLARLWYHNSEEDCSWFVLIYCTHTDVDRWVYIMYRQDLY